MSSKIGVLATMAPKAYTKAMQGTEEGRLAVALGELLYGAVYKTVPIDESAPNGHKVRSYVVPERIYVRKVNPTAENTPSGEYTAPEKILSDARDLLEAIALAKAIGG